MVRASSFILPQTKLASPPSDDDRVTVAPDDAETREAEADPDPNRIRPGRYDFQDVAVSGMKLLSLYSLARLIWNFFLEIPDFS